LTHHPKPAAPSVAQLSQAAFRQLDPAQESQLENPVVGQVSIEALHAQVEPRCLETGKISSEYAVIRPQSAANANKISNFPQTDLNEAARAADATRELNGAVCS
jgi:hypothetical protein